MRLLFYLSGEHAGMAEAEVRALFEVYHIPWNRLFFENQVVVYEAEVFPELSRLSMTHKVLSLDFSLSGQPFRVRVKKLLSEADSLQLEKEIADDLQEKYGRIPVDLENPEQEVYCIIQKGVQFVGKTVMDFPYSYEGRKPHYRPYFHPSSVHPRIARALVNLGRCSCEVLDPFCGTGGILIEAGLMGLKVKGLDVSEDMVVGTRRNLEHFGITAHEVFQGDATLLKNYFCEVESVVTDMPYGKASRLTSSRKQLYEEAFESIRNVTKKACIVVSRPYDFERIGYIVKDHFILRVHKSLDRHVYVLSVE
ncbi:MAG: methyltransferase domain-containing protein, partial [Theionarchaea archaeon]|nr:methyltransferase domain-containing protein [Theionarchaea archaeon]